MEAERRARSPARRCAYRLQLSADFTLEDAAGLVDYLAALGVSHVFTSPLLQSAPGSAHGYDGTDPTRIDAERGGDGGARRFWDALADAGLGHLLDIVPNHLSTATPHDRWWWDVLRRGRRSPHARVFDVDWEACDARSDGAIELPILDRTIDAAVAEGALRLGRHADEPAILWGDTALPLDPERHPIPDPEAGPDPDALRSLLAAQRYRLVPWWQGRSRLAYRRFFDIDSLIGVRVEDPEVFRATHARVLSWVLQGRVDGLRVDHPDGLAEPAAYLARLARAAEGCWILAEKILEPGETLRASWPIDGTTGYDFLSCVGGLFVDPDGEGALTRLYVAFTGADESWPEVVARAKRHVLEELFRPEVGRLERALDRCRAPGDRAPSEEDRREAMCELLVAFPVYRSYVEPASGRVEAEDVAAVEEATARATRRRPELAAAVAYLGDLLLLRRGKPATTAEFVRRFQQTTGPLMAKGVEDHAFYTFVRFVALNEVGGDPSRFGVAPEAFHDDCARRAREHPQGLLAISNHDTKRSGDVRARLALLSEIPGRWAAAVARWRAHNARHRREDLPDRKLEYFLYQTLVGAHPLPLERARAYLEKSIREARTHTSWTRPDARYEEAVLGFAERVLGDAEFLADVDAFVAPLVAPGRVNALAQTLIQLIAPGVPNLYQGGELWDLSLVDPDNRRPVDFALRRRLLRWLDANASPEAVLARADEGVPKLWVTREALALRRRRPDAFAPGSGHRALWAEGTHARRVVAFARVPDGVPAALTVTPRLVLGAGDWRDTFLRLPPGRWRNVLGGDEAWRAATPLDRLWARFPVALLVPASA